VQSEENARRLLERPLDYPGLVQRRGANQEVRIWRAPSFDPESSWTIIADKSEWFVRRVVYVRRSAAGEIWHDTFASEARLAEPVALSVVRDLRAICIVPFVKLSGLGLDGTAYGIETGSFMAQVRLSWWGKAPEEWGALRSWYAATIGVLESQLPPSTTPLQALHPWVE
jgi:hypothetical protein